MSGLDAMHAWATPAQTRVFYQWMRLERLDQWWHWILLVGICVSVVTFVVFWYRRDSVEHRRPIGWALLLLRLAALVGLLLHFMQLDKRTEQRVVRESRVAVLVDTSLSMTLPGTPSEVGAPSTISRAGEVARLIEDSDFLAQLAAKHQLAVYRFDSQARPTAVAAIRRSHSAVETSAMQSPDEVQGLEFGRKLLQGGLVVGGLSLACIFVSLGSQIVGWRDWAAGAWLLLVGSVALLVALSLAAVAIFPNTSYSLGSLLSSETVRLVDAAARPAESPEAPTTQELPDDWSDALQPSGAETRLGDAIRSVLDREVGNPLAGIIVLTDGRSNAGVAPKQIAMGAHNARAAIYFVGVGSEKNPPNVQVVEVDVAKRLYPGDQFSLSALIGGSGFEGRSITVQVTSGPKDGDQSAFSLEAEQSVEMPVDGSVAQPEFQLEPRSVGQWEYHVQIVAPPGDEDSSDNMQKATVEVVERKNRVLIIAGGPTREYQFVRNLMYRDRDVESHVLLQTGTPNSSQESQELLSEFPETRVELSQYDAILSFDADWTAVPDNAVQALEQWVAEQAGGFLLVAGSVEMPKWISRSAPGARAQFLRALSPVVLDQRGSSLLAAGRIEAATAWPLQLTEDGRQTDFLWVDDDPQSSFSIWNDFSGVHGFYSAYELKPGAKAFAYFTDPSTMVDGQLPIYLAGQFYGAGRVVFLGGGEIWRMRRLGDQYFDRFYTKLVRWISQGRLLLDSDRGILLVDREQAALGDQVVVRAVLKNEQYEPLVQSEVVARLIDARGKNVPLVLRPLADGSQPGVYTGQFPVLIAGEYTIQLQLGGIASNELLDATVRARVPASEMQDAQRNDALMRQLASETGGQYWAGTAAAAIAGPSGQLAVVEAIQPQDSVAYLPGAPDRTFQVRWLGWLMTWIAGCLSLEWLARRVHRLA